MNARLITAIRVRQLFGLYTYELPETGEFSNAAILYGDNGVGKSTLLRLAFHLLSAADDKGHRSALYNADFESIEIALASGITLTAKLQKDLPHRTLTMEILKGRQKLAIWDYQRQSNLAGEFELGEFAFEIDPAGKLVTKRRGVQQKGDSDAIPRGNKPYLEVLGQVVPTIFILNADRRLDSDSVSDPSDEMELRRVMHYEEPKRINELVVRSREIALSQALSAAGRWIAQKAVIGANQGSMNVHSVYVDVLNHLLTPTSAQGETLSEGTVGELVKQFAAIEARTTQHSRYELATQLSTVEFRKALSARGKKKSTLAAELLTPYVKSLERRLEAIDPIYQTIDRFVTIVNGLLSDKSLSFKLSQGFSIHNRLGNPLTPAQLSSGEQQLLLLFCYVLTARDKPSVFMIDEPEISLNIKWQRQLIQSLLDITHGATIQFIFASHSMELLAQHRSRVVKLVSKP
jgi:energy-coupling factor transporter ATP-binding protein EcfA2